MDRLALKEDRVTTQGGQQGASSASEISNNKSFLHLGYKAKIDIKDYISDFISKKQKFTSN